jgi:DNA modification methylase
MTEPFYTDPLVTLLHGDCIEVMASLEADSVDAVVTDPPYGLEFMGKGWDAFRPAIANRGGKAPGRSKQDPTKFAPVAYGIGGRRSTMV